MSKRLLIAWLGASLVAVVCLSPATAPAMEPHVDCREPFVFDGADVNVVALPYRSAGEAATPVREIGQRLALLIKLDVLSHILEYGSIGAVQMEVPNGVRDDAPCRPELVIPQLLGQRGGARTQVAKGHGVIFVWGILYEEQQDIVVQSYARFLRRDSSETIALNAGGLEFRMQPDSGTVAFSPQLLSKKLLDAVAASYSKADFVRTEARDDAPGEPLPRPIAKCFNCGDVAPTAFQVDEKKGEWIHVRWLDPRSLDTHAGWIHAAGGLSGQSLHSILPELSFVEGTVGYLRQRVAVQRGEHLPKALAALTERSFESFQQASEMARTPTTAGIGRQLGGVVQLLQDDGERLVRAHRDFDGALAFAPYSANAMTLAAVTQIAAEWNQGHSLSSERMLADRLTAAAMLSDDSAGALNNLWNFYKLLQMRTTIGAEQQLSPAEVAQRLHDVDLIRTPPAL